MQFAAPEDRAQAYLILRHLYDGDVIEWPIADDHPLRAIFESLEQQGEIARWDRTWPRHDRYRLTERGIATIEAVYRPAGADAIWNTLRTRNLPPRQRRSYLEDQGYDPLIWALLHDPSTHWDAYRTDHSRYVDYLWENDRRRSREEADEADRVAVLDPHAPKKVVAPYVVDLDTEAQTDGDGGPLLERNDYDVS